MYMDQCVQGWLGLVVAAAVIVVPAQPTRGDEVVVAGRGGISGAAGAPGVSGGNAGPGEAVSAESIAGPRSVALAQGGRGGFGGVGGDSVGMSIPAGVGGNAGVGGGATAIASPEGSDPIRTWVQATADGGDGGRGGAAGSQGLGDSIAPDGNGGNGGRADATISGRAIGPRNLFSRAFATGGDGGDSGRFGRRPPYSGLGGNGGAADGQSSLVGNGTAIDAAISARGGDGGEGRQTEGHGIGGDATSTLGIVQGAGGGSVRGVSGAGGGSSGEFGRAGDGTSIASIRHAGSGRANIRSSSGGGFGSINVDGGEAVSTIDGRSTSSGNLVLEVIARGGDGRVGGGSSVSAYGEALTAGLSISVDQSYGDSLGHDGAGNGLAGRNIDIADVADGRAAYLSFSQTAQAGSGGNSAVLGGRGGRGGNARSAIRRDGANAVSTTSLAGRGGQAAMSGARAGQGGDAWAESIVEEQAGSVRVSAEARSGSGGEGRSGAEAGDGGSVSFGRVFGSSSDGSSVSVSAAGYGGHGGRNYDVFDTPDGIGGRGADVVMIDVVDGQTSGDLSLFQSAVAGGGGLGDMRSGDGGVATSSLTREFDGPSVDISLHSMGGGGARVGNSPLGRGGDANTTVRVVSRGGDVSIRASAESGGGALTGDATIDIYARVEGDGHSLGIGADFGLHGAFGSRHGWGGDAFSRSVGEATGDSIVRVVDRAVGGVGGIVNLLGTRGGDALSSAKGSNRGSSLVEVSSYASGGSGGPPSGTTAPGQAGDGGKGEAWASGHSTGGGDVIVRAVQAGGRGGSGNRHPEQNGAAQSSFMLDQVEGWTTGRLTLEQIAIGGSDPFGTAGADARSILKAQNTAGGSINATSEARGGAGGGAAHAQVLTLDSTGADMTATALATGGAGGLLGRGGASASVSARGESTAGSEVRVEAVAIGGDGSVSASGSDITLNDAVSGFTSGSLTLDQRAIGGNAGATSRENVFGRGGSATSVVNGKNRGGGDLSVHSLAEGGSSVFPFDSRRPLASGGDANGMATGLGVGSSFVAVEGVTRGGDGSSGGYAHSSADGRGFGSRGVDVIAEAFGGNARDALGRAGDANATASGTSSNGPALVVASAVGGRHLTSGPLRSRVAELNRNTRARAQAFANGPSGSAESRASGRAGFVGDFELVVGASANAQGQGPLRTDASAGGGARRAFESDANSAAGVGGIHERMGEWTRIGLLLNTKGDGADSLLAAEASLQSVQSPSELVGLHLSFLDFDISGSDISDLRFQIQSGSSSVLDQSFSSRAAAESFFSTTLDLGMLLVGLPIHFLNLDFRLEGGAPSSAARVGTYFAIGTVVVPEPGTAVLLGLGLIWFSFGWNRRRVDPVVLSDRA